jgi:serine/threonine protein kinase
MRGGSFVLSAKKELVANKRKAVVDDCMTGAWGDKDCPCNKTEFIDLDSPAEYREGLGNGKFGIVFKMPITTVGLWNKFKIPHAPSQETLTQSIVDAYKSAAGHTKDEAKKALTYFIVKTPIYTSDDVQDMMKINNAFKKEALILKFVGKNNNIVSCLGFSVIDNLPAIVFEYCPSKDLQQYFRDDKGKMLIQNPIIQSNFALNIATGMDYLHGIDIVHLDLAARNVLVCGSEEKPLCKITDFGLSEFLWPESSQQSPPNPGTKPLSARWRAPEFILTGKFHYKFTKYMDVWSFGITMYEILSQKRPYRSTNEAEYSKIMMIPNYSFCDRLFEDLYSNKASTIEQNKSLYDIIKQCMNLNPTERPTFTEIIKLLNKHPTPSPSPSPSDATSGGITAAMSKQIHGDRAFWFKQEFKRDLSYNYLDNKKVGNFIIRPSSLSTHDHEWYAIDIKIKSRTDEPDDQSKRFVTWTIKYVDPKYTLVWGGGEQEFLSLETIIHKLYTDETFRKNIKLDIKLVLPSDRQTR